MREEDWKRRLERDWEEGGKEEERIIKGGREKPLQEGGEGDEG